MKYGWQPDTPDFRDRVFCSGIAAAKFKLPPSADMRDLMPPVYDQGQLGSCTANAIAAAIQYERRRQGFDNDFVPSRLFIYYNERNIEGTVGSDAGAMIRDGIKAVARLGDCNELEWPYDPSVFATEPSIACYTNALKYRAVDYWRVPRDMVQMRGCLAAGYPFVFGFSVYSSFESPEVASSGMVPMPAAGEQMLGGHAVLAVGYDDAKQCFLVRNSWGTQWSAAMGGYFWLPYAFLLDENLSNDMWVIKAEAA